MTRIALIFFIGLITPSCKEGPTTNRQSSLTTSHNELISDETDSIAIDGTDSTAQFRNALLKALKVFPKDSASLSRFYNEWNGDELTIKIKRLRNLTSTESVRRYREVDKRLEPLLHRIVSAKTISRSQADSVAMLYALYDYFSGEALFSNLLTADDNYNLVWNTFEIMANESEDDTCYIAALIRLGDDVRTNVELAEAMPEFIVKSIRNNPTGFLEMYSAKKETQRAEFVNHASVYDTPDKELLQIYTQLSKNSSNELHRKLAVELLGRINE